MIAAATTWSSRHPEPGTSAARKRIIHIDSQPAEVDGAYIPEVELVGDIGDTLNALRDELPAGPTPPYATRLRAGGRHRAARRRWSARGWSPARPPSAPSARAMAPEDILVSDVGAHKLWLGRHFPAYEPNTVIISNGFATMGIGLPGAIAAKLALPERRVVTRLGRRRLPDEHPGDGDGATRLGLPLVVVVWVDGGYGVIGWKQERRFGRRRPRRFGNPALERARVGLRLGPPHGDRRRGAARGAGRLLEGEGPALISVPIDYGQNVAWRTSGSRRWALERAGGRGAVCHSWRHRLGGRR